MPISYQMWTAKEDAAKQISRLIRLSEASEHHKVSDDMSKVLKCIQGFEMNTVYNLCVKLLSLCCNPCAPFSVSSMAKSRGKTPSCILESGS